MKYAVPALSMAMNNGALRFDDVGPPVTREPWTPVPATVVIMPVLFVILMHHYSSPSTVQALHISQTMTPIKSDHFLRFLRQQNNLRMTILGILEVMGVMVNLPPFLIICPLGCIILYGGSLHRFCC